MENYTNVGTFLLVLVGGGFYIKRLKVYNALPHRTYIHLNLQAGRPGLPPLKCTGSSNKNTAANSGLSTWGFNHFDENCWTFNKL